MNFVKEIKSLWLRVKCLEVWRKETEETPSGLPYKVYTALLTQTADAPVATVLDNTIGEITYSYNDAGNFTMNSDGLFTLGKTFIFPEMSERITLNGYGVKLNHDSEGYIGIITYDDNPTQVDGVLNNYYVEIRVYP